MMDWDVCLDGKRFAEPEVFHGQVGHFSFEYVHGQVRHLRWRETEIARRIYATVRDIDWGTAPVSIVEERIEEHKGDHLESLRVQFSAIQRLAEIDYAWQGQIEVKSDGSLEFSLRGTAQSTFQANRVGFCLLHPIESLAGKDCKVIDGNGNVRVVPFRNEISPDNPATDVANMQVAINDEESLSITFLGELFETEDQRNWIDDSFKTFCTPLSKPRPIVIPKEDIRRQSIRLSVQPKLSMDVLPQSASGPSHSGCSLPSNPISIEWGDEIIPQRHRVGLACGGDAFRLSNFHLQHLRVLHPDHIRVDVNLGNEEWPSRLLDGMEFGLQIESKLEIAIHLASAQTDSLKLLAEMLQQSVARIARCCIYSSASSTGSEELNRQSILALRLRIPGLPVYAGTLANFAELNRRRPSLPELSGLCFAAQPQEHAFDNASLIETPRALGQAVYSARQFAPGKNVCVGPLTLRRQFNPFGQPIEGSFDTSLPATVDPRQMSLLGAAWTLASLKYLAESGSVASTWYEPVGWKGIMADEQGSPLPDQFSAFPKTVYPVFHVLADWCSNPTAHGRYCHSSDRLQVECAAMQSRTQLQLLIVNLQPKIRSVRLPPGLGAGSVRSLDQFSYATATKDPAAFRNGVLDRPIDSAVELQLSPFSYSVVSFK